MKQINPPTFRKQGNDLIQINAETFSTVESCFSLNATASRQGEPLIMPQTAGGQWKPISTAPFDRDLELAVADRNDFHALVFRCRRVHQGWVNSATGKRLDVYPTHWRDWPS